MGKMLYQLVKEQSAPAVDIEEFGGNPLHYNYLRSMFREVVEEKIADPQGEVTRETVWEPIQAAGMLQKRNKADDKNQTWRCSCIQEII